ncbi:asparagine synthase-related protein [Streptomyces sp. NPDC057638]|uniref:asparagine synthase-related protein n=1 Tax=Streptomyces sp. NPDC057638 TaxID=3346190 RepID=UPI003686B291
MVTGVMEQGWYFVVLPDHESAEGTVHRLAADTRVICQYPSGRPLMVARMPADQLVTAEAGPVRGVVAGISSASAALLRGRLGGAGGVRALDGLGASLAGSFHLVAADGDRVRVQGSASGVRRVFHALVDGVRVVSDRADVLAALGDFPQDETALAVRLLGHLPYPFGEEPLWRQVTAVPPGSALLLEDRGSRTRTVTWWRRPEPELSRRAGARLLRSALGAAVDARTAAGGTVHCDLSGGLDSTPLCYLAAQGPAEVTAVTAYNDDPGGREDLDWARLALPSMPTVRHRTASMDDMTPFYRGMDSLSALLDEPTQAYTTAPRIRDSLQGARAHGARLSLNGLGGDHMLHINPAWEHSIVRRRPLLGARRIRTAMLLENRSWSVVLRELFDGTDYRTWLQRQVREARPLRETTIEASMAWDAPLTLPRWLTREATEAIRTHLAAMAAAALPLGPDRARHGELAAVLDGSHIVRGVQQFSATLGIPHESPFFDDRVIEACFAVRHEERASPLEFKPLIKAALAGELPDAFLARSSKTGGDAQGARGLRDHWPVLLALCEDSPLARDGLIDVRALAAAERPDRLAQPDPVIDATVNCAVFTRNHAESRRHRILEETDRGPAA